MKMKNSNGKPSQLITLKNLLTLIFIIAFYVLIVVLVEFEILNMQHRNLIVPIGINIMLAVSLNLVTGFLGELSLGHAGFMAIGAYTSVIFTLNVNLPGYIEFPLAIFIGGMIAALFGFLIGIPVLRLRGDYLAIVTLGFGEIIRSIIKAISIPAGLNKAGELIIQNGSKTLSAETTYTNYTWVYFAVIITILACGNLVKSRHGRVICSIRDNDIAAESIGIRISRYKIMAFVFAAFFAGVAGVLYGHNFSLGQAYFKYDLSINILVFVVLGGMGSIWGSVIAAFILTLLPELLRSLDNYRMLMYAILLIAMMIFNSSKLKVRIKEINIMSKLTKLLKFDK